VPLVAPTTTTRSRGPRSRSREGEGYQALTGAVLRVLAPLDGSGCARGTHVRLPSPRGGCSDAVRRGAPTLRSLVPCCSRPLESPFRAFPSRGAVPALAGPFSHVGSRRPPNGAARSEGFAAPFACCADLAPRFARRLTGLEGRDKGSLESLGRRTCHVAVVVCDVSSRNGRARRTRLPARPLRSFALPESPFADTDRRPGQGAINRSVLSWTFFPSRAFSSSPWVRYARG